MAHPDQHPLRQEAQLQQELTPEGEVGVFINDLRVPREQAREMAIKEFGQERVDAYDAWTERNRLAEEKEAGQ